MQQIPLAQALGGIAHIPQFFVWRLTWDDTERKYKKKPVCGDAQLPHNWQTLADATTALQALRSGLVPGSRSVLYALGWMFTPGCGYWFFDLDACLDDAGNYTPNAAALIGRLPGCFFEFSSGGRGCHVLGRDTLPAHGKRNKLHGLELYTERRGICFGQDGTAWGNADTSGGASILQITAEYFPPTASGEDGEWDVPRSDWRGPADDAELLTRARASRSVAARLGTKATFAQLFDNAPELDSFYGAGEGEGRTERDAALAQHLAFWTGCDAPRIERIMRTSALARPKWDEHRTYLRELTINRACALQRDVLTDRDHVAEMYALPALPPLPMLVSPASVMAISDESARLVESLLDMVGAANTWLDIHNHVIPAIRASSVPPAMQSRLENAVNKRLDLHEAKLPINKLRALLWPPRIATEDTDGENDTGMSRPDWANDYVYVQQDDCFFDLRRGNSVTRSAFTAEHDRSMPIKGDGPQRQDSAQFMLQHWGTPVVFNTMYYPGQGATVVYGGREYANLYSARSVPLTAPAYTAPAVAQIDRFRLQLWHMCGQRETVFHNVLSWLAHNVQFPGKKIRWMPVIKGVPGDGKSILASVLRAAMGHDNVMSVGPDVVCNTGGFTDWAHGHAVVVLEELHMGGRERYRVANTVKPFITNDVASINPKGDKPKTVLNTCNQLGLTNHTDGVPIEENDRRYFVVFTPYASIQSLCTMLGVATPGEHFDPLWESLSRDAGQWRKWLLELPIPAWFAPNSAAPTTDERDVMSASGGDDLEMLARDVIEDGGVGLSNTVICTENFNHAIKLRALSSGVSIGKEASYHHLLNRMGYQRVPKQVKWDGRPLRFWVRSGFPNDADSIRQFMDATRSPVTGTAGKP